jgi:hypothetical protein
MNGDLDENGWRYSGHFKSKNWISIPSGTSYVRQRRFIRMITKTLNRDDEESEEGSEPAEEPIDLNGRLERCRIDRERIGVLREWIKEGSGVEDVGVEGVFDMFENQGYKTSVLILLRGVVGVEGVREYVGRLWFYSDRRLVLAYV